MAIGLSCIVLALISIFGVYAYASNLAEWAFNSKATFFVFIFHFIGILYSIVFIKVGYDWIVLNISPFQKSES